MLNYIVINLYLSLFVCVTDTDYSMVHQPNASQSTSEIPSTTLSSLNENNECDDDDGYHDNESEVWFMVQWVHF